MTHATTWTDQLDQNILRKWKEEAEVREKGHRHRELYYRRLNRITMLTCLILSGMGATGIMTLFDDCTPDPMTYCAQYFELPPDVHLVSPSSTCGYEKWMRLGVGILTAITTTAMGIREFLNLGSKAEAEKDASYQYGALARAIDELLLTPWSERAAPHVMIAHIRSEYDHIIQSSPTLPDKMRPDVTPPPLRDVKVIHDSVEPIIPHVQQTSPQDERGSHESTTTTTSSSPSSSFFPGSDLRHSETRAIPSLDDVSRLHRESVLTFELALLRHARREKK